MRESRRPQSGPKHLMVGKIGEDAAFRYLVRLGYGILARNCRIARDEIDIIAFDPIDEVLVFVEVKTRSRESPAYPVEYAVGTAKCRRLTRSARGWITKYAYKGGYRLDLLCVVKGSVVRHFRELRWVSP